MTQAEFMKWAKNTVLAYAVSHTDQTDGVSLVEENVFIVWYCKTLQNHKALLSTTLYDGMYYEFTYNGDKDEAYLDAYKKWENKVVRHD
jgi:hypothetical protein